MKIMKKRFLVEAKKLLPNKVAMTISFSFDSHTPRDDDDVITINFSKIFKLDFGLLVIAVESSVASIKKKKEIFQFS